MEILNKISDAYIQKAPLVTRWVENILNDTLPNTLGIVPNNAVDYNWFIPVTLIVMVAVFFLVRFKSKKDIIVTMLVITLLAIPVTILVGICIYLVVLALGIVGLVLYWVSFIAVMFSPILIILALFWGVPKAIAKSKKHKLL